MTESIVYYVVILIALSVNLPLIWQPLTEDEGNFYYLAQFYDRGAQIHSTYDSIGFFNIPLFALLFTRLVKSKKPQTYQCLKVLINTGAAIAVSFLAYTLTQNVGIALGAGLAFVCVTCARVIRFWATYGEHVQIIPVALGLAAVYLCLQGQTTCAILAGFAMGFAFHIKPTGFLLAFALIPLFLFAPSPLLCCILYSTQLIIMFFLPYPFLRKKQSLWAFYGYKNAWHYYRVNSLAQITTGYKSALQLLGKRKLGRFPSYVQGSINASKGRRLQLLNENLFPCLREMWFIPLCAVVQIFWGLGHGDIVTILLMAYLGLMLLTQHLQQNYYVPHFNIIWPPLCILAAMFFAPALAAGCQSPLSLLVFVLCGVFLIQRAYEAWKVRDTVIAVHYLEAACTGKALYPLVQRTDTLLAWGLYPSINIYADCPGIPTHLFTYTNSGNEPPRVQLLTQRLRENPPQWITFFQVRQPLTWDIAHIIEVSGNLYTPVTVSVPPDCVQELVRNGSALRRVTVYRLNDQIAAVNQYERAHDALCAGDTDKARALIQTAGTVYPEESALRLLLLDLPESDHLSHLYTVAANAEFPRVQDAAALLLAELFTGTGDLTLMRKVLTRAVKTYAQDPRFHRMRAAGRTELTARFNALVHALDLHPFYAPALRDMIVLLLESKQHSEVPTLVQRLLKLYPDDQQALAWQTSFCTEQA